MPEPLVSVLIPLHNAGPMIALCLRSVFAQTHRNLEVIVVDNASTDDGPTRAAEMLAASGLSHKLLSNSNPRQQNVTRRMAYEACAGAFVQWLDADDVLFARKIERQLAALTADPGADIASGEVVVRHYDPVTFRPTRDVIFPLGKWDDPFDDHFLRGFAYPHRFLFRGGAAKELHEAKGWHPDTPRRADYHHMLASALLGHREIRVPDSSVFYSKWGPGQLHLTSLGSAGGPVRRGIHERLLAMCAERGTEMDARRRRMLEAPTGFVRLTEAGFRARSSDVAVAHLIERVHERPPEESLVDLAARLAQLDPALVGAHAWVFDTLLIFVEAGWLEEVA